MLNKLLSATAALILVLIIVIAFGRKTETVGSVTQGGEYQSETIVQATTATGRLLCTGAATLGTINLTGAAASYMEVYDASTTNALLRTPVNGSTATTSLRKLATIPVSAAAFSWTYDSVSSLGLVWEVTGTKATTTLTYRCYN